MASLTMILNSSTDAVEDEDEGPFIDLEFSIPDEDSEDDSENSENSENSTHSLSPSNDFFSLDTNSKPPPFPSSLLKSATKLRVFMLGSKKPKSTTPSSPKQQRQSTTTTVNNFVRFTVEQVPLVSLFTRDNSEKVKSSKEVVHRYLNKIKKLRFSGQHGSVVAVEKQSTVKDFEMAQGTGGSSSPLRLVTMRRGLGKSRSASAAVAAVRSPPRRRDDSLLQQQDGIQSAIAHCKRSFHADKGVETQQLVRSNSDPGEINQLKFK